jgi:hypothetical protein
MVLGKFAPRRSHRGRDGSQAAGTGLVAPFNLAAPISNELWVANYLNEEKNCQVSLPQFAGKACPNFRYEHSTNGLAQLLNDEQTLELTGVNVVESMAVDVFEHEFIER